MSKSFLVTRPINDPATKYLYVWSDAVINIAKKKYYAIYDLEKNKATRKNLESYIEKHNPSFTFINGHGNALQIFGHNNQLLIDQFSNLGNATILYARSCDAAQKLGQSLIKNGVAAFIGYTRKFIFGYLPEKTTRPQCDSLAALFLEPSNLIASTIIKGHTTQEAHNRSLRAMYRNFTKMISSVATFEERYSARWLWSNINSQVLLGDPNKTI